MDRLSENELKRLLEEREKPCVSIYMPTPGSSAGMEESQIRLKNLLRQAEERLIQSGMRSPEARKLLAPVTDVVTDALFWQHPSNGLVIFVTRDMFDSYRLSLNFKEQVVINERFYIKPLLEMFSIDGRYYVLAVSQNELRLLECTRYGFRELVLPDSVPKNMLEFLNFDRLEETPGGYHIGASGGPSKSKEGLYPQAQDITNIEKNNILRYFQSIDRGLQSMFARERSPMVLVGVDFLHPIYREANTYDNLLERGVTGNPEGVSSEEIQQKSWAIVQPYFTRAQTGAIEKFNDLDSKGRTQSDIKDILPSAYYGRVDTLFIAPGTERWGRFDPDTAAVTLHDKPEPGDEELVDFVAVHTLLNRGVVYPLAQENIPCKLPVAATLRY